MSVFSSTVCWFGLGIYCGTSCWVFGYGGSYFLGQRTQVPLGWKSLWIFRMCKWIGKENSGWLTQLFRGYDLSACPWNNSSVFLLLRVPAWGLTSPGCMPSRRRLGGRGLQCVSPEHRAAGASLRSSGLWGRGQDEAWWGLSLCFDPKQSFLVRQAWNREVNKLLYSCRNSYGWWCERTKANLAATCKSNYKMRERRAILLLQAVKMN